MIAFSLIAKASRAVGLETEFDSLERASRFDEALQASVHGSLRPAALAVVVVAVAATPAFAGKPVASYTITLTCPAGTYGYITNVALRDSKGNVVSPAGYALECGTSPFGSVPQGFPSTTGLVYTSAKATQVSAGLWYCEDNRNAAGILGGTFFGGSPFAKGPKPTVASCPNVPDIKLTIS